MALSYAGMLLVFGHELSFEGSATLIGGMLVFGSAVSYAVYLVFSGELVKRHGSLRLVGLATSVACLLCLLQFLLLAAVGGARRARGDLALAAQRGGLHRGAGRDGDDGDRAHRPGLTAQAGMIGPLSTIAMGALVLGESLNGWIVAGTALVLSGVLWVTRARP